MTNHENLDLLWLLYKQGTQRAELNHGFGRSSRIGNLNSIKCTVYTIILRFCYNIIVTIFNISLLRGHPDIHGLDQGGVLKT